MQYAVCILYGACMPYMSAISMRLKGGCNATAKWITLHTYEIIIYFHEFLFPASRFLRRSGSPLALCLTVLRAIWANGMSPFFKVPVPCNIYSQPPIFAAFLADGWCLRWEALCEDAFAPSIPCVV